MKKELSVEALQTLNLKDLHRRYMEEVCTYEHLHRCMKWDVEPSYKIYYHLYKALQTFHNDLWTRITHMEQEIDM